jgi:hypothetical protein
MTNIVVAALITVDVVTNWGSETLTFQDPAVEHLFANDKFTNHFVEVATTIGWKITNATATIVFNDQTNVFTLSAPPGSVFLPPDLQMIQTNFYELRSNWATSARSRPSAGDFHLISSTVEVLPYTIHSRPDSSHER